MNKNIKKYQELEPNDSEITIPILEQIINVCKEHGIQSLDVQGNYCILYPKLIKLYLMDEDDVGSIVIERRSDIYRVSDNEYYHNIQMLGCMIKSLGKKLDGKQYKKHIKDKMAELNKKYYMEGFELCIYTDLECLSLAVGKILEIIKND